MRHCLSITLAALSIVLVWTESTFAQRGRGGGGGSGDGRRRWASGDGRDDASFDAREPPGDVSAFDAREPAEHGRNDPSRRKYGRRQSARRWRRHSWRR